jgi:hypothetical protein
MNNLRKAVIMVLKTWDADGIFDPDVLRAAPAIPEQEPVAWMQDTTAGLYVEPQQDRYHTVPLYTAPPRREWRGLTKEDEIPWDGVDVKSFAKAIEAKLKEKNHE